MVSNYHIIFKLNISGTKTSSLPQNWKPNSNNHRTLQPHRFWFAKGSHPGCNHGCRWIGGADQFIRNGWFKMQNRFSKSTCSNLVSFGCKKAYYDHGKLRFILYVMPETPRHKKKNCCLKCIYAFDQYVSYWQYFRRVVSNCVLEFWPRRIKCFNCFVLRLLQILPNFGRQGGLFADMVDFLD